MADTIAFFSSDARELYKADVFRALALPKGYVLQFRYLRKYIHHDLLTTLDKLKGQQGQIVFVTGNSLDIPVDQRKVEYHPIRQVVIKDIYTDQNIETVSPLLNSSHDPSRVFPAPFAPTTTTEPTALTEFAPAGVAGIRRLRGLRGVAAVGSGMGVLHCGGGAGRRRGTAKVSGRPVFGMVITL